MLYNTLQTDQITQDIRNNNSYGFNVSVVPHGDVSHRTSVKDIVLKDFSGVLKVSKQTKLTSLVKLFNVQYLFVNFLYNTNKLQVV